MKKKKREEEWKKAKKLCRLSNDELRMARELGMTPRSLMKNVPGPRERWKAPVKVWVRDLYKEKFGMDSVAVGCGNPLKSPCVHLQGL